VIQSVGIVFERTIGFDREHALKYGRTFSHPSATIPCPT
jgi:hypothetical protein